MTDKSQKTNKGNRIYFLDNLRTFMIFIVVLVHSGWVYESSGAGAFFWIIDDYSTNSLADYLNFIMDIFVMSTIFFVSGFLTPLSLKNKNAGTFIKTKFKRLIIPWGIAVLTLMPLYKVIYLYSRSIPQESLSTYFHWNNGFFSQNWLWFLPVLFLFDMLYLFLSKIKIDLPDITLKKAVGAVFIIGFIYSLCMDIFQWQDWTKTAFLDFQNERLLIYFMVFLLGSLCYKLKTFESKPKSKRLYTVLIFTVWMPTALYLYLFMNTLFNPGNIIFSDMADTLLMWFSFHISLLSLLYIIINTFRLYLDKQGKILAELSSNSYNVYIIHVVVMGGIALIMLNTAIPSLLKYFILTVSTYAVCNLLVYFYRKVIKSRMVINRMEKTEMKTLTTALMVIILLAVSGCGNQEISTQEEEQSPEPPGVTLHVAALQGNIVAVRQHIKASSDLNEIDSYGSTPLIIAITFDKTDVAKALVEAGADLKITNSQGATPLHLAAFFCRTEVVRALLDKGADKNAKNNTGSTPLETVAVDFDIVKPIYDGIGNALKPFGFKLDYDRIKAARPQIAEMLR